MRSVPIQLPVNAGEAAALAGIVLEHAEGRNLEAARNRIAALVAAQKFASFGAYPGSLQRDPIHPSTFYMAADSILLRLAAASSPSSGLFPDALLIGRMRTDKGREVVVNAIPFAASDYDNIRTYAGQVDRHFLPRTGLQRTGMISGVRGAEEAWHRAVWQAIRSGWREGWSATLQIAPGEEPVHAADFTRFSVQAEASLLYAAIHKARGRRHFDFELDLSRQPGETAPEELTHALAGLRAENKPAQFVAPHLELEPRATLEDRLARLYEAAREANAILSLPPAFLEEAGLIGKLTGGRVNYRVHDEFLKT